MDCPNWFLRDLQACAHREQLVGDAVSYIWHTFIPAGQGTLGRRAHTALPALSQYHESPNLIRRLGVSQ